MPSEVFIGRQPIFDRDRKAVGYEILFRSGHVGAARVIDGSMATATVMLNALTEIGLERLVGARSAWINLTRDAALSGLGMTLPPAATCFEILEGQLVDDELLEAITTLRRAGYRIALDDFELSPAQEPLVPLADYVKLDYAALGPEGFAEQLEMLASYDVQVVAEKVETQEEHVHCMELGCDLFQGFFYKKPEVLSERRINLNRGSTFQLIVALQNPTIELEDLERLIALDVPLSVRLLRYLNSAFLGVGRRVTSIREALILLGTDNVRRWATLTVMSGIEGKTSELTVTALSRARFCELAGVEAGLDGSQLFTVGLFSLLDAMMDAPLEVALADLPFSSQIRNPLLHHSGRMGEILAAAIALESDNPDEAAALVQNARRIHVDALIWAQAAAAQLADPITGP